MSRPRTRIPLPLFSLGLHLLSELCEGLLTRVLLARPSPSIILKILSPYLAASLAVFFFFLLAISELVHAGKRLSAHARRLFLPSLKRAAQLPILRLHPLCAPERLRHLSPQNATDAHATIHPVTRSCHRSHRCLRIRTPLSSAPQRRSTSCAPSSVA